MCKVIDFVVEKQKRRDCKIKGEVASDETLERFLDTLLEVSCVNPSGIANILGDVSKEFHIHEDCMVDTFTPNPNVVKSLGIPVINTGGEE